MRGSLAADGFDVGSISLGLILAGRVAASAAALLSCSVIYDPAEPRQCVTDADCEASPALRGRRCDPEYGVCVAAASTPESAGCQSTALCTQQNSNYASVCRTPGQPCVRLETPECPMIVGDWRDPAAIVIGSIGPQTQVTYRDGEQLHLPYVPRLIDAINLGREEWSMATESGFGGFRRPLAIVHCDSGLDAERAKRVMGHLITEVEAPLVMAVSDVDLAAIANLAIASDTALMCLACYARPPDIDLERPLAWYVQPPLEDQAPLAAWRVSDIEQRLRAAGELALGDSLRVALLGQRYSGITDFADRTRSLLRFNGGRSAEQNSGAFFELQTGDPRTEQVFQIDAAQAIASFRPHVIVVAVDSDFTTYYLRMIEEEWPVGVARPFYVATSMNQELGLLAPIVAGDDDLRGRISGTGLAPDAEVSTNLENFAARFRRKHLQEQDNTEYGYDASYVAAYALALADAEGVSGASVNRAIGALTAGAAIDVGPDAIASGLAYLIDQRSIDLSGTSSRLDWDPRLGNTSSDIGLWCLSRAPDGSLGIRASAGPVWSRANGGVTGSYACP